MKIPAGGQKSPDSVSSRRFKVLMDLESEVINLSQKPDFSLERLKNISIKDAVIMKGEKFEIGNQKS